MFCSLSLSRGFIQKGGHILCDKPCGSLQSHRTGQENQTTSISQPFFGMMTSKSVTVVLPVVLVFVFDVELLYSNLRSFSSTLPPPLPVTLKIRNGNSIPELRK